MDIETRVAVINPARSSASNLFFIFVFFVLSFFEACSHFSSLFRAYIENGSIRSDSTPRIVYHIKNRLSMHFLRKKRLFFHASKKVGQKWKILAKEALDLPNNCIRIAHNSI